MCALHAGFDFGQGEESNYFLQGERGYHQQWDSRLYNYKNWEVLRYLLSNVRWWLDEFQCVSFSRPTGFPSLWDSLVLWHALLYCVHIPMQFGSNPDFVASSCPCPAHVKMACISDEQA